MAKKENKKNVKVEENATPNEPEKKRAIRRILVDAEVAGFKVKVPLYETEWKGEITRHPDRETAQKYLAVKKGSSRQRGFVRRFLVLKAYLDKNITAEFLKAADDKLEDALMNVIEGVDGTLEFLFGDADKVKQALKEMKPQKDEAEK